MRYYMDAEFHEDGQTIDLISIGIVAEDGRELYCVSSMFYAPGCNPWVQKNVLPRLPPKNTWIPRYQIAKQVRDFITQSPTTLASGGVAPIEIWTYFGAYDWVVLCQLFGTMMELPSHFPMFTMDLKQYATQLGIHEPLDTLLKPEGEHDALEDARWNQRIHWRLIHQDGHRGLRGVCPVCEFKL